MATSLIAALLATQLLFSAQRWDGMDGLGFVYGVCFVALLMSTFMRPALRGAGVPLIVACGFVCFLFGALAVFFGMFAADETASAAAWTFSDTLAAGLLLVGLAAAGWLAVRHLAAAYGRKRFSDQQLAASVYWALLTVLALGVMARDSAQFPWYLSAESDLVLVLGPIKTELFMLAIGLLWIARLKARAWLLRRLLQGAPEQGRTVLLLRVFKPPRRTETFVDRFLAYWRFAGPVWMIAGPDLGGAYMEPNEFFDWARGRLREHVVADPREADARIGALDARRDPDGRFRVGELYCTNESWRPTVGRMIRRADAILLDLREYNHQREGTRYELAELLRAGALGKLIVLVDTRDDLQWLEREVASIAAMLPTGEAPATCKTLRVLACGRGSTGDFRGLFAAVASAATARA